MNDYRESVLNYTQLCRQRFVKRVPSVCDDSSFLVRDLKFTVLTNFSCQVFFLLSERLVSYEYDILISPTCMYMYTVWTNFSY